MAFLGIPAGVFSTIVLGTAIVSGAALCFFGHRLFKVALGIAGFVCGFVIAAYIGWKMTAPVEVMHQVRAYPDILDAMMNAKNPAVLMVCGLAGGVAGALLSTFLDRVGVFMIGASLGVLLANLALAQIPPNAYVIALAILALLGGILALTYRRAIVIISTALNGALAMMFGMYGMIKDLSPPQGFRALRRFGHDAYVLLGCIIVLGFIGAYVQWRMAPKGKEGKGGAGGGKKKESA